MMKRIKKALGLLPPQTFEPDVELLYRIRQNAHALPLARALLLVAALGVLLFGVWDYVIDPTVLRLTLPVRALCSIVCLMMWAAVRLRWFRNRLSWVFSVNSIGVTLTIAWVLTAVQNGVALGLPGFFYVALSMLILPRFRVVVFNCVVLLLIVNIVVFFNGELRVIWFNANFFLGFMCFLTAVLAYLNETRDRRIFQLELELEHLANTDGLSGAFNRRHFTYRAQKELERAQRYGHPLSLLIMDIDHFKRINDTYGHSAGDLTIRALVETCRGLLRNSDFLGRIGGEEFAILLPESTLEAATQIAARLRESLGRVELPLQNKNATLAMTVSIGVASLQIGDTFETLMQRTDDALYKAKDEGRNRIFVGNEKELALDLN
ncbi:MAG TPA: GGDEF domain-containing protein [Abditibacteriaceae bacterium]|nr:GGDEF domain-containing protein [Abditibacteriaceae bacterium]